MIEIDCTLGPPKAENDNMARTHALERTSPKGKGEKFIGRCIQCGKEGLTIADMTDPCENTRGLTQEEALLETIKGPEKK